MTLFSLFFALALERIRPLGERNNVCHFVTRYIELLERNLNAGANRHGIFAWVVAVIPLISLIWFAYVALYSLNPLLALCWNIIILYLTIGFRRFSGAVTEISEALAQGRDLDASQALKAWTKQDTSDLSANTMARLTIEQGVLDSYRSIFGTVFWFVLLPGPIGAALYRLSQMLRQKWAFARLDEDVFGRFAKQIATCLDWLPVRLTAVSFAIVGDFEDAVYCWRAQARTCLDYVDGILMASAAGALGIKLGETLKEGHSTQQARPELGLGDEAEPDHVRSAIGLVWRSVLLWLFIIMLTSVVRWLA